MCERAKAVLHYNPDLKTLFAVGAYYTVVVASTTDLQYDEEGNPYIYTEQCLAEQDGKEVDITEIMERVR